MSLYVSSSNERASSLPLDEKGRQGDPEERIVRSIVRMKVLSVGVFLFLVMNY